MVIGTGVYLASGVVGSIDAALLTVDGHPTRFGFRADPFPTLESRPAVGTDSHGRPFVVSGTVGSRPNRGGGGDGFAGSSGGAGDHGCVCRGDLVGCSHHRHLDVAGGRGFTGDTRKPDGDAGSLTDPARHLQAAAP